MNYKLAVGGLFCAACLLGCSSPPKLLEPSGAWENLNPPISTKPVVNGMGGAAHVPKK